MGFLLRLMAMALSHRRSAGETIRNYRRKKQWSQEKLAEKADINPKYLSEVERGHANISLDVLARIARALGIRVGDLVAGI